MTDRHLRLAWTFGIEWNRVAGQPFCCCRVCRFNRSVDLRVRVGMKTAGYGSTTRRLTTNETSKFSNHFRCLVFFFTSEKKKKLLTRNVIASGGQSPMIATRRDENKKVLTYLFGLFDKAIVESYLEKGIGLPHRRVDYSGQLRFQNIYNVVLLLGLLDIVNFRVGEWKMGFWPNIGKSEPARPGFQMFPNSLFSLISRLLPYWLIKKDRKRVEQKQENRHTREKKGI